MSMSSLPQLKHNEPPLCARPNAGCLGDRQMGLRPFLAVIPNLVFLEEKMFSYIQRMSEIPAGGRCSEQKTKVRKRQMV